MNERLWSSEALFSYSLNKLSLSSCCVTCVLGTPRGPWGVVHPPSRGSQETSDAHTTLSIRLRWVLLFSSTGNLLGARGHGHSQGGTLPPSFLSVSQRPQRSLADGCRCAMEGRIPTWAQYTSLRERHQDPLLVLDYALVFKKYIPLH